MRHEVVKLLGQPVGEIIGEASVHWDNEAISGVLNEWGAASARAERDRIAALPRWRLLLRRFA